LVVGTMAEMLQYPHPWVHEYFHGPRSRAAQASHVLAGQGAAGPVAG
jgi:phospholipid/cholesterol/gamma-HCH transport system ATP-binding protein